MNSVWLREKGEERTKVNKDGNHMKGIFSWAAGNKSHGCGRSIDPILGISLESNTPFLNPHGEKLITIPVLTEMEHDLEEGIIIGEEGNKRARGELGVPIEQGEINIPAVRNRRVREVNHLLSAAAKKQADRMQ